MFTCVPGLLDDFDRLKEDVYLGSGQFPLQPRIHATGNSLGGPGERRQPYLGAPEECGNFLGLTH